MWEQFECLDKKRARMLHRIGQLHFQIRQDRQVNHSHFFLLTHVVYKTKNVSAPIIMKSGLSHPVSPAMSRRKSWNGG